MAKNQPVEVLLRPAVELYTVAACIGAAIVCVAAPWSLALSPSMGIGSALAFMTFGAIRLHDAWGIVRYRRNIRRLPRYVMTSDAVPVSQQRLFIGRGFLWEQKHTHRLMQTYRPEFRPYAEPTTAYQFARRWEERLEFAPFPLSLLIHLTRWDMPFNPIRPLPPVGGLPRLHGIEPDEVDVWLPLGERVGHSLVLGTTRVGKTRLAELFITQDIRRKNASGEHEVVIVFDPKGDADLLKRMVVEAQRAGRAGEFYLFHLGWPEISARYNAVGRFGRISEVATRIAGQLSGEGNSAAFREFAWRFVNIIARALIELGQRPDYLLIQRHVINIDALFIEYAQHYFAKTEPKAWEVIVQLEGRLNEKNIPRNMIGREKRVIALEQYLSQVRNYDPVLDGLRSAVRYDKTYFDKIVASLLPLLEKLTSGKIAQLLAPNYSDLNDLRPIFDWMQMIRKRAVVYVGLDALSDAEVAAAVGNSMFSDLVSVTGHIYKHGIDDGLPGTSVNTKIPINLHADEFNELMGDEFIPMINKGGGAGIQVTAYTQTLSDIKARIGNRAKAGQVIGKFNNLLSNYFTRSIIVQKPGCTAHHLVDTGYDWVFVKTGLLQRMEQTRASGQDAKRDFRYFIGQAYVWAENDLIAAAFITLTFGVRLLILILTLPLILTAAFVGLIDGLVRRDVRRFGAGRESGFLYHRAKASLLPLAVLPWVVYLALPVSVHPLVILLPSAALLGLAVNLTAASFKKYL